MKNIHPKSFLVKFNCACGTSYQCFSSAESEKNTDVCSNCNPFYTGKDTRVLTGQADKFRKKQEKMKQAQEEKEVISQRRTRKAESEKAMEENAKKQ